MATPADTESFSGVAHNGSIAGNRTDLGWFADVRTNDYALVQSIRTPLSIVAVYLLATTRIGRYATHPLPPMEFLKWPIVVYNFAMVLLNAYIACILYNAQRRLHYSWACHPPDYTTDYYSMQIVRGVYLFYLSKIIELADTVFLVLRKKWRQLSFLHLYHHASMIIITWVMIHAYAGGNTAHGAMVNASVHVLMYTYYALAALASVKRHWNLRYTLWSMKKYMTLVQLAQFAFGLMLGVYAIWIRRQPCTWHMTLKVCYMSYVSSMAILFSNFYYRAYIVRQHRRASELLFGIKAVVVEQLQTNQTTHSSETASNGAKKAVKNGLLPLSSSHSKHQQGTTNGKKLN